MSKDSYQEMLAMVQSFHNKHDFKNKGGEDLTYRIALMAEELGEMSACITKGNTEHLAEESADLLILLIGTAISANFDLNKAFWTKMDTILQRPAKIVDGKIRVSEFKQTKNQ